MGDEEAPAIDTSNGVSQSGTMDRAADRAAFLASVGMDEEPAKKEPAKSEPKDDDSDLDEEEKVARDEEATDDADEDDDSDLDEDEDEDDEEDAEEEEDGKQVDAETAKRLSQVKRTDKRLREQRDRDFKARETELEHKAREREASINAELERWKPRAESAERFEKLAARVDVDPVAVLQALGLKEDRYEYAAQVLYTLAKAKDDPKARAAAAQIMKAREIDDELTKLKQWRDAREKADQEREEAAAADAHWTSFFERVAKTTSEKTPLAQAFLKANPTKATERIMILTYELAQKAKGAQPKERDVIIALEKDRRQVLRELGIDPKSLSAKKANEVIESKAKTKATKGKKPMKARDDDNGPMSRDDFIAFDRKFD